jgi:hypothetical protein
MLRHAVRSLMFQFLARSPVEWDCCYGVKHKSQPSVPSHLTWSDIKPAVVAQLYLLQKRNRSVGNLSAMAPSAWFHFFALIPEPWERAGGEDIEDGGRKIPVQLWAPAFRFVFSTLLSPGRRPWLVLAAIARLTASWSPLVLGFSRTLVWMLFSIEFSFLFLWVLCSARLLTGAVDSFLFYWKNDCGWFGWIPLVSANTEQFFLFPIYWLILGLFRCNHPPKVLILLKVLCLCCSTPSV